MFNLVTAKDGDRFDLVSKPLVNLDFDGNPFVAMPFPTTLLLKVWLNLLSFSQKMDANLEFVLIDYET